MRKLIAASLFVLPTLMHAQQSPVRVEAPKMMAAAAAVAPKVSTFTGIIAPKRITDIDRAVFAGLTSAQPVVAKFTVDAQGVPQNIVVEGTSEAAAAKISDAVSKLRYQAGKLNGQSFDFPVVLKFDLR